MRNDIYEISLLFYYITNSLEQVAGLLDNIESLWNQFHQQFNKKIEVLQQMIYDEFGLEFHVHEELLMFMLSGTSSNPVINFLQHDLNSRVLSL
mgnify:CR=1 FL=1